MRVWMPPLCLCLGLVVAFEWRSKRITLVKINNNSSKRRNYNCALKWSCWE